MALPNFLICGTQKGGTTALYYYLKEHPEIYLPEKKEVHYFDLNLKKGLDWYEKHFRNIPSGKIAIGEATPEYMYFEWIPEKIHEVIPDAKLIFILRNPVDRAYSHYWHEVKLGYEKLSFTEAIDREEERLASGNFFNRFHYSYKDRGKYVEQLKRFEKYFSADQMLILLSDDLKSNPEETMVRVFEFLGVNSTFRSPSWYEKRHEGLSPRFWVLNKVIASMPSPVIDALNMSMAKIVKYKYAKKVIERLAYKRGYPPMEDDIRNMLLKYFKPYNKELERFLKMSLPDNWYGYK